MPERRDTVDREVRVDDPNLSPEANRILTDELRESLGTDHVELPADRAGEAGRHVDGTGEPKFVATLASNRLLLIVTFVALVIVGVIVSLATHNWWALVAACAVHAVGTLTVGTLTLRLSTEVEHVPPTTAARLEDEGVGDPDRALSNLVEQYAPVAPAPDGDNAVSTEDNRVTASPDQSRAQAAADQTRAITPAGTPVGPSGDKGAPVALPIAAIVGSVVIGVVAAIAIGGIAWLAALLLVAASVGWLVLVRYPRLPLIAPVVVLAVVAGVIIIGAIAGYL